MRELNPNKPVQTVNGRKAEIKHSFKSGHHFIVFPDTDGWQIVNKYGKYSMGEENPSWDIINTPERIEGWTVYYQDKVNGYFYSEFVPGNTKPTRLQTELIACVRSSFTVGEGLE